MGLRTAEQYKSSLRDGRAVFFRGERVADVTAHPVIGIAVEHAALDYRMAHDPKYRELAVVKEGADEYSRYYHVPQNGDDLLKRSRLIAAATREGATLVVLIKEIGTDAPGPQHHDAVGGVRGQMGERRLDRAHPARVHARLHAHRPPGAAGDRGLARLLLAAARLAAVDLLDEQWQAYTQESGFRPKAMAMTERDPFEDPRKPPGARPSCPLTGTERPLHVRHSAPSRCCRAQKAAIRKHLHKRRAAGAAGARPGRGAPAEATLLSQAAKGSSTTPAVTPCSPTARRVAGRASRRTSASRSCPAGETDRRCPRGQRADRRAAADRRARAARRRAGRAGGGWACPCSAGARRSPGRRSSPW